MEDLLSLSIRAFFFFLGASLIISVLVCAVLHFVSVCEERGKLEELRRENERLRSENYLLAIRQRSLKEEMILHYDYLGREAPSEYHEAEVEAV